MSTLTRRSLAAAVASVVAAATLVISAPHAAALVSRNWNDFNDDGYADLAVGAPNDDVGSHGGAGVVNVIYGSANGLKSAGNQVWQQDLVHGPGGAGAGTGNHFGTALATGDFNDDGYADLAVGAPDEDVSGHANAGAVVIIYGGPSGLTASGSQALSPNPVAGAEFGAALVALDAWDTSGVSPVKGADSHADLAVGKPGTNEFFAFPGSASGLETPAAASYTCGSANGRCGAVLAAGDIDGDGVDELVAGAPDSKVGALDGAGEVVIESKSGSLSGVDLTESNVSGDSAAANAHFGAALAVGDVAPYGNDDLLIGAPDRAVTFHSTSVAGAGVFDEFQGSSSGISASLSENEGSANVPDNPETGDHFGTAIAIGDFGKGSGLDLAVGAPGENVSGQKAAGAVIVLYPDLSSGFWTQDDPGVGGIATKKDLLGQTLYAADFGRSNQADLAIGVLLADNGSALDAGEITVLYGTSANGLVAAHSQLWSQNSPGIGEKSQSGDHFSAAMH